VFLIDIEPVVISYSTVPNLIDAIATYLNSICFPLRPAKLKGYSNSHHNLSGFLSPFVLNLLIQYRFQLSNILRADPLVVTALQALIRDIQTREN